MTKLILALAFSIALAACGLPLGPVDTGCHINPRQPNAGCS
jgi:hypothetical protein